MSHQILKDIIEDFQVEKVVRFLRTKNNKFRFPNEPFYFEENAFQEGRKIAEANLEDGNLIVCSFLVNQNLSERSGKKAQYELGKKILKGTQSDAGIFIFYDNNGNFRFSLIYTNYLGRRRDWSNYRRFTYFVSKQLTNKTFLQRIGKGDFSTLEKIKEAFSVEKVTKEFYREIANWYFWAVKECKFPPAAEQEENGRNISIIRLITRMIFIWFMKIRQLIPDDLFKEDKIKDILNDLSANKSTYYKAILQNLFFATLNTRQQDRRFRSEVRGYKGYNPDFGNHNVYRYHKLFKNQEKMQEYFGNIPFLNGGLFECLDYKSRRREERYYIDGFTDVQKYQPYVPNFLFFQEEKEIDLNEEYGTKGKSYKVRGLINILSSYNFTIDENEPDDLEVALDPELLGRVFENLLASYNPETATTARKATGSYYTPREIVDYMVTQSLKYYFKTHLSDIPDVEEKLSQLFSKENYDNRFDSITTKKLISLIESLRVVDPAVGSGAFPMGILNKLVFILSKLDPQNTLWKEAQIEAIKRDVKDPILKEKLIQQAEEHFKNKDINYLRKLYLIEKCIYGVDIQQIAVEIAKLRFFISLLVDEKIDKTKPNWGIEPLPNLDFKLMQGNSLISSFAGIDFGEKKQSEDKEQLFLGFTSKYDNLIKEFEEIKHQYQNEPDKDKKDKLREKIEELILQIFEEKLKEHLPEFRKIEESASKIPNPKHRQGYITAEEQKLAKKYGFDFEQAQNDLIAYTEGKKSKNFFLWDVYFAEVFTGDNPGFDIVIANPPYIKEYINRKAFDEVRNSPYYQGKMDIWYLFACNGIDLLKSAGIFTFIAQNNWVTSYGAKKLRKKVIKDTCILELLDFGDYKIFKSSGIQTMIMIFKKDSEIDNYTFEYRRIISDDVDFKDILALINKKPSSKAEYLRPIIQRNRYLNKPFTFSKSIIENILNKMLEKSNFKLYENEIAQGIVCPQDRVIKSTQKVLGSKVNIGDGVFVLSDEEKARIPFTKKELELIKPYYTTKELGRYYANKNNSEWIIYTDSKFKNPENIKPYPNIKKHLDKFQKVITSDNKPYGLHRARDERFFKGEKIIALRKCIRPTFTYADFDSYVSAAFYVIKTNRINLKYLVGLLNSKLIDFWLRHRGKMQGNNYQIDKEPLLSLPLVRPDETVQKKISEVVSHILSLIQSKDYPESPQKQAKVKEYEREIDQLVYKLYGLTEEEIKIVEDGI